MLGTTKPPYSLRRVAVAAPRRAAATFRLIDLTAARLDDRRRSIARLDAEGFAPTLILFPSTTPTLDADVAEMAQLKARFRRADLLLRPARLDRAGATPWRARRGVDGMFVGEPEDAIVALASRRSLAPTLDAIPSLTYRRDGDDRAAPGAGHRSPASDDAVPGVGPPAARRLHAAARRQALRARRDQPRLPVLVRLLRRADPSGPQVPRARSPKALVDEIERAHRELGVELLLSLGRHRHAEREDVQPRSATS